ncbi:MAG: MBL fold metallo-hydrolase [Pseudomonadota bacterium]
MNSIKLKIFVVLILLLFFSTTIFAEKHHKETLSFRTTQVSEQIWMLQGKGGNVAILSGKHGLLMVDDDYKVMTEALKKQVQNFGGLDQLTYIINTHWHGDHTQGNLGLGEHALIVAHDNVRARLLTRQEIKLFKMTSEPYPEVALPSVTYNDSMTLYINEEEVKIVHYPSGHTDGDSIVFFKNANVVHMGDHFFSGFFPFVDIEHGGNVLKMAANVNKVIAVIDNKTKVIPGHGPLSTKSQLVDFYNMLLGTSAEVKTMMDAGLVLDKIKAKGLSKQWDIWTKGFIPTDVWIGIVYSSLMLKE